jgi:metallo-beta-lactamase family protein
LFGEDIPVRAKIVRAGSFSGHADWEEMLDYLCLQKPEKLKTVFLVHGEEHVQKNWANRLQEHGFSKVLIPDLQQEFEIG